MSSLSFYAGASALQRIKEEGLHANMFSAFLGASGGPKWFVLCGLDKVMFNDFLHDASGTIDIIGSSAGAFRASCFAQRNPKAAIERLAQRYSNTVYSAKPTPREITDKGVALLHYMMSSDGVNEVLTSTQKRVHIIVARCHGLVASERKSKQLAGLLLAGSRNFSSRSALQKSFTRSVFSSGNKALSFTENIPYNTEHIALTEQNFLQALMASGSIPAVIEGVKDIPGAPLGMYRDGGIIDYHFDMAIQTEQLVMYPHFYPKPIPGWFDKGLKSRCCAAASYDKVLMITPSEEFVRQLPYGKIPDRKDFEQMDAETRIKYWHKVIRASDRLADEFLSVVANNSIANLIKPINLTR